MIESALKTHKHSKYLLWGKILVSLIAIVLLISIIELTGYIWERKTSRGNMGWTLVASRRMRMERRGTADCLYYLFEPDRDYQWEGIPVSINSRGLRGKEFQTYKPGNVFRILNLGDSVVFGWEVDLKDRYGNQLEEMLNEGQDERKCEIISAGVPGWNLEAARNFLILQGLSYHPDLILLDITLVNDVYGEGPHISKGFDFFEWMRDHTYFWPFLTTQTRFLLAKKIGPEAIPVFNPPLNATAYFPVTEDSDTWDGFWASIMEINNTARSAGIPLVLVVFPTAFQLNSARHPDTPQMVLKRRSEKCGIPLVDLLPIYEEACLEARTEACEGYENLLFADVWMHPNKLGHRLAAEAVYKTLQAHTLYR